MIRLKRLLPYLGYFALFCALSWGESSLGMRPFLLGVFMALVYSRQNLLLLIPCYVAAVLMFWLSWQSVVYAICPVVIILAAMAIHYKLKKPLNPLAVNCYVILSALPLFGFAWDVNSVIYTAVAVVGNVFFFNVSSVMSYAVTVRGMRYRLSPQEGLAIALFGAVVALCLSRCVVAGFPLLPMIAVPIVAYSALVAGYFPLLVGGVVGAGAALGLLDLTAVGMYFIVGAAAVVGNKRPWLIAPLAVAGYALAAVLTDTASQYLYLISAAVGAVLYILTYKWVSPGIEAITAAQRREQGGRFMINRTRLDVAQKLSYLSAVFGDMEQALKNEDEQSPAVVGTAAVIDAVKREVCQNCMRLRECEEALGGDSGYAVSELVEAAERRGKATILDTPPYLSARCGNVNSLIDSSNRLVRCASERAEGVRGQRAVGDLMSRQMGGVAGILDDLKKDVEQPVSYDTRLERRLIDELQYRNVRAVEAIVYREQNDVCLTLIVASGDENKYELSATINKIMGTRMYENKREQTIRGNVTMHFIKEPQFALAYGSFGLPCDGVSGDKSDAAALGRGRVMVVLSDGMGSGEAACRASTLAVSMLEGFYKAGFQHGAVLSAASKLLTLRGGEEFNAVDLAVVDLETAQADFIKLGGREGYILSRGAVDEIPCGSLPIGIVDEVSPCISRRSLADGDTFVLLSDGVADILDREKIEAILTSLNNDNPNLIAKEVVSNAVAMGGRPDDMSCVVGRIFRRVA